MAEHGRTSKSQLPNVLAKMHEETVIVTIELTTASYDELRKLQGDNRTVSASIYLHKQNVVGTLQGSFSSLMFFIILAGDRACANDK